MLLANNTTRALNVALRCATLGTRFLFIFFLAKYLDPASVGYYGIFTATIGYALYFVGLDFYTYASREIVKAPAELRGKMLKGQAALSSLLYLALLPIGFWIINKLGWPNELIYWFIPILIFEHINQEMSRLLVALSEQLTASIILFVRQGSWALAIIGLMYLNENTRNLNAVMLLWSIAGLAAVCVGVWKLIKLKISGWYIPIDWAWVKNGIVISISFLVATLALRGVQTFDRYWVEALSDISQVGAYVLLFGIASTLLTFLDAAVFSFTYPILIRLNHTGEHTEARRKVKQLLIQTLIFCLLFNIVSWALLPYLLVWINNPIYQQALPWYPWLLLAMTINALGMVPHYALYARGVDKPIIYSSLVALPVFIISTWTLSQIYSAFAVILGLNLAFFSIFIIKTFAYLSLIREETSQQVPSS